ncbi:atp-dependent protease la domain-containing protein [Rutstroemia sp. NJR-2017a BBW]|nr:atp-dependent protease la domain-containing protein [Rutstroemia sp. NJR-2017a BBW]
MQVVRPYPSLRDGTFTGVPELPRGAKRTPPTLPLDGSRDARDIIRLIQCSSCNRVLRNPKTFPCGYTFCETCLPETYARKNISYPGTPDRVLGFKCSSCGREHAQVDCSRTNIVMNNVINAMSEALEANCSESMRTNSALQSRVQDVVNWPGTQIDSNTTFCGGKIAACYQLVRDYGLPYDGDVTWMPEIPGTTDDEKCDRTDTEVLAGLKNAVADDLKCQVCLALFTDPVTTTCGHTFCRNCLHQIMNRQVACPICRTLIGLASDRAPTDILINNLVLGLFPAEAAARAIEAADEVKVRFEIPCFICTVSFPSMPTYLHIFEPKYRAMIARVYASEDRNFGMLLHNPGQGTQGAFGGPRFWEYGTLLHIENYNLLEDGRSLVEARGVARFKVVDYKLSESTPSPTAYTIGTVERVNDIGLADEEAIEALQTSIEAAGIDPNDHPSSKPQLSEKGTKYTSFQLDGRPTRDLLEIGLGFVRRMEAQSAPWLHHRVIQAYDRCPEDAATFPWWFASVLPTKDAEKYKLLATTSVRERLKICIKWIMQIEGARRYVFLLLVGFSFL